MSILDMVQQQLGQNGIEQISQQIGASSGQTQSAIQAAVPMMLGGMAGTAQQGNAGAIQDAMTQHEGLLGGLGGMAGGLGGGLGGALGGLGAMLGGGQADRSGMLGSILGGHQQTVHQGVEQASGLSSDQTRKLLLVLAPIVLAFLAKRHANAGQQDVNTTLQREAQDAQAQAQRSTPHIGGLLGKILSHVETPRS